jgi:Tol biopolymer transport system component
VNSDGTNAVQLTSDTLGRIRPAWSPDSTKIAASIDNFPNPIVQVIDVATGAVNFLAQGRQPSWSFDGKRLVFVNSNSDPNDQVDTDVFMININGTGRTRVTPNRNVTSARWFR